MAIVGVFSSDLFIGAINTDASASLSHNFGASNIWGYGCLRRTICNDDDGGASVVISKFVDASGTHVPAGGIPILFSPTCKSVTYLLSVNDCIADAICNTQFFA